MAEDEIRLAPEEVANSIIQVLQYLYAATKTATLYPPDNPSVQRMVENAYKVITDLIPVGGALDISFVENKIIVNRQILDESLQKRPIVGSFNELMKARRARSVTFWDGITKEDLIKFLAILGTKAPEVGSEERVELDRLLEEQGIRHIEVDEQMYVAISKREKVVDARVADASDDVVALKALKDEIFARFLAGEVSPAEVDSQTMKEMIGNPEKMLAMVEGVISEKGWDTEVEPLPFRIDETRRVLERVSTLVEQVDDPLVRNKLNREVSKITSKLDTPQLAEILLTSSGLSEKPPEMLKVVLPLLENPKLTAVVKTVVGEYTQLAREQSQDEWASPRMLAMKSVLEEATAVADEDLAKEFGEIISRAEIDAAGPEPGASISGVELARSLMAGADMSLCDEVKGPSLVWAARTLFENDRDDLGAKVMERLADRFMRQSPEARITAAQQIWGLFQVLREIGKLSFAGDMIDEVSEILDQRQAAVETFSDLARTMEKVSGEETLEPDIGTVTAVGLGGPGVSVSSKTIHRLMTSDTGKVVQAVFSSGDDAAKEAISRVLLEMEDRGLPALIETAMEAQDEETFLSVVDSIRQMRTDPIPLIASRLGKDLPPDKTVLLVKLVSMLGDETSVSIFNPLLVRDETAIHSEVIRALGKLGGKQALQMLLSESLDADTWLRTLAIRELGKFRDFMAVRRLLQVISPRKKGELPEDDGVIMAACRSLGDLGARQATPMLAEIAGDLRRKEKHPEEVRAAAAMALGAIGGDEARKALKRLLKDRSLLVRSTARKALNV